jgi:glycosyltransferase involved in cell wall biosynthesis
MVKLKCNGKIQLRRIFYLIVSCSLLVQVFFLSQVSSRPYYHLRTPLLYFHDASIIHISREIFPDAAFGGLGRVVGDIASEQIVNGLNVIVVLPAYPFLLDTLTESNSICRDIPKSVMMWDEFGSHVHINVIARLSRSGACLALISVPEEGPFANLWSMAVSSLDIYKVPRGIDHVDREDYFSAVSAALVVSITKQLRSSCHHRICCDWGCVGAQIHGSLQSSAVWHIFNALPFGQRPIILYTLHDYGDEFLSLLSHSRLRRFSITSTRQQFVKDLVCPSVWEVKIDFNISSWLSCVAYTQSYRIGTELAISLADVTTTVSKGMVDEILRNSSNIPSQVRMSIHVAKVRKTLDAIPNALGANMLPFSRNQSGDVILNTKIRAKRTLCEEGAFNSSGCTKWLEGPATRVREKFAPWLVLFIGRIEKNKGAFLLPDIARRICSAPLNISLSRPILVAVLSRSNPPFNKVFDDIGIDNIPCGFSMWTLPEYYDKWASLARFAADLVVIPSSSEAFGLVAAEAQAFGSIPVVSWVGGLRDIVQPLAAHIQHTLQIKVPNEDMKYVSESCLLQQERVGAEISLELPSIGNNEWNGAIVPIISLDVCEKLNSLLFASTIVNVLNSNDVHMHREAMLSHLISSAPRWNDGSVQKYTSAIENAYIRRSVINATTNSYNLISNLLRPTSSKEFRSLTFIQQDFSSPDLLMWNSNFLPGIKLWRPFPGGDACIDVLQEQDLIKMSSDGSGTCGYSRKIRLSEPYFTSLSCHGSAKTLSLIKRSSLIDYGIRITAEFADGNKESETIHFSYTTIGWQTIQGIFNSPPRSSPMIAFTVSAIFGEDGSAVFNDISAWLTHDSTKTL